MAATADIDEKKKARMMASFTETPPFPREILLEPNNTCNHKCRFCAHSKMARSPRPMPRELGARILAEAFQAGARDVGLFATGEPFASRDLAWFVAKAKELGYEYVFLDSNGALASPELAKPVMEAGVDSIKFSINAGTRESYLKVHGVDDFETVLRNIRWLHSFRRSANLPLRLYASMVVTAETRHEVPILKALLDGIVDKFLERECSNQGGNMLENNTTETINKENLLGSRRQGEFSVKCTEPFNRLTVSSEGFLTGCVVDYSNSLIMADLRKASISEAWHSPAYRQFRRKHLEGRLEGLICLACVENSSYDFSPTAPEFHAPYNKGDDK